MLFARLRRPARAGYLLKGRGSDEIDRAQCAGGRLPGDAGLRGGRRRAAARLFAPGPPRAGRLPQLVEREREVLELWRRAPATSRSPGGCPVDKTVRNYVSTVFAKLAVRDRAQAIVRAREAGLGA
jgi:hypothetical protein